MISTSQNLAYNSTVSSHGLIACIQRNIANGRTIKIDYIMDKLHEQKCYEMDVIALNLKMTSNSDIFWISNKGGWDLWWMKCGIYGAFGASMSGRYE